jgi:hypothetical protein
VRTLATTLMTLAACAGSPGRCDLVCGDRSVVTAHTQIPTTDLTGDTIVICVNGTTCSSGVFDGTCGGDSSCSADGAFAAEVTFAAGNAGAVVTVESFATVAKADGDVWSISIVDGNGTAVFSEQAPATYDVEPGCDATRPPCHDLALAL